MNTTELQQQIDQLQAELDHLRNGEQEFEEGQYLINKKGGELCRIIGVTDRQVRLHDITCKPYPEPDSKEYVKRAFRPATPEEIEQALAREEDEPIKINGQEVTKTGRATYPYKVGCTTPQKDVWIDLSLYITSFDISIHRKGEDITEQIKKIAEKI